MNKIIANVISCQRKKASGRYVQIDMSLLRKTCQGSYFPSEISRKTYPGRDAQEYMSRKICFGRIIQTSPHSPGTDFTDEISRMTCLMNRKTCPGTNVQEDMSTMPIWLLLSPLFIIYYTHIRKSGINWLFCTLLKNLLVFGWFQNSKFRSVLRPCSFPSLPKFFCKFVFAGYFKL